MFPFDGWIHYNAILLKNGFTKNRNRKSKLIHRQMVDGESFVSFLWINLKYAWLHFLSFIVYVLFTQFIYILKKNSSKWKSSSHEIVSNEIEKNENNNELFVSPFKNKINNDEPKTEDSVCITFCLYLIPLSVVAYDVLIVGPTYPFHVV